MKWQIITPPAAEPLAFADVASQARIDGTTDQSWVESFVIPNARATAETEAQVSLITQTIAATIYNEQDGAYHPLHSEIRLPRGPVQSIVSVVDGNGNAISNGSSNSGPGTTTINFQLRVGPTGNEVLTDATSVTLNDPTNAFGVRRVDNGAVVVAAGTALTHTGTGIYSYSFADPAPGLLYEAQIQFVLSGNIYYDQQFATGSNPVSSSEYELRRYGLNDFLHLKAAQKFPITITYVAGYGDAATDMPANIKGIMLAHCAFLYDNRGADVEPTALDRIYRKYRSFAQ